MLLSGDPGWAEDWVLTRLAAGDRDAVLWIADRAPSGIEATAASRIAQRLGSECRLLVFDAHQGFHPDAFAAAVGTLRGGGDCVVLAPSLAAWPQSADPDKRRFACYPRSLAQMHGHFLARLVRCWEGHAATRLVTPDNDEAADLQLASPPDADVVLSAEQTAAVAAVERVAQGHARRPLVLTADRGRGKSTVLGVAAGRLLLRGLPRVTVVAAHRAAASTLFAHALASAGGASREVADTRIGPGRLCFRLPAECLADADESPGLVLVDEAAAIPVAVLRRLLEHSNRLVFASTVHGYEGSARGFELRFQAELERRMPQWRALRLQAPVRWAAGDPLEALVNESLLLDADLGMIDDLGEVSVSKLDSAALAADESLLRATFGLLINAHYQTRPSDLRQLLDNPDSHLWLARRGASVVGVLQVSAEGGFDQDMAAQILSGSRRPRGHLLPQSLAVHAGLSDCLTQRVLRVQRIAVHPRLHRQGIGTRLLEAMAVWGGRQGFDMLGCAYGAERALLMFWQVAGFVAVRLGVRVDPASAAHSLFMLRGLSVRGRELATHGAQRFLAQLPWSLGASLRALDGELAVLLLRERDCRDLSLDHEDLDALGRIAQGMRLPATADALLWRVVVCIAARAEAPAAVLAPLLAWLVQHHEPAQVCRRYALRGRAALDGHLRSLLSGQAGKPRSTG